MPTDVFLQVVSDEGLELDYAAIFNPSSELFDVLVEMDKIKNLLARLRAAQQAALYRVGRPTPREFVKATQRELTTQEKRQINKAIGEFYDPPEVFATLAATREIFVRAIATIDFMLQESLEQAEHADVLARMAVKAQFSVKINTLTEFYNTTCLLLQTLRKDFTRGPLPMDKIFDATS